MLVIATWGLLLIAILKRFHFCQGGSRRVALAC